MISTTFVFSTGSSVSSSTGPGTTGSAAFPVFISKNCNALFEWYPSNALTSSA